MENRTTPRIVGYWLLLGFFLVFIQIIIGGITRLTDSGLSITEWNIIKGILPPLSESAWLDAFQKYKEHTLQFEAIHQDMNLKEFKFIFFWEWFHRLWARSMGFVFLFPFLYFLKKGYFTKKLLFKLSGIIGLASIVASMGWIMVASGLDNDQYVWVDAYKLSMHLGLAVVLFIYILYLASNVLTTPILKSTKLLTQIRRFSLLVFFVAFIQIIFGAWMSGMKAGMAYPHFPHMTANGSWIPDIFFDASQWTITNFFNYNNAFAPTVIQVFHRSFAYLLTLLILVLVFKIWKHRGVLNKGIYLSSISVVILLIIQVTLGILTLVNCVGDIPVVLGVLHQCFGMLLLASIYVLVHCTKGKTA